MHPLPLDRRLLARDPLDAAAALLGQWLLRREPDGAFTGGRLVEVEAYGGQGVDQSAHGFAGPTPRCAAMFEAPGTAYVYATQGRCVCLNVSVGGETPGAAVLLRALQPLAGIERMRDRRLARLSDGPTRSRLLAGRDHELASGPGRLCLCLDVDRALDGVDLTDASGPLFLARSEPVREPSWTPRIGLNPKSAAYAWAWRAVDPSSPAVSGPRALSHRGPLPRTRDVTDVTHGGAGMP